LQYGVVSAGEEVGEAHNRSYAATAKGRSRHR
jgi:hypothetical protein